MTLTQLEYILAVDKFRHFGKAARSCFVTQPTLSMQLQKLEDELGVVIFDRSKSPILPTSEGEVIINQARVIIREEKRLLDLVQRSKDELAGDLRLAVIPTLSTYILPLFLQDFVGKYPNVNLVIEESKTEEIVRMLAVLPGSAVTRTSEFTVAIYRNDCCGWWVCHWKRRTGGSVSSSRLSSTVRLHTAALRWGSSESS